MVALCHLCKEFQDEMGNEETFANKALSFFSRLLGVVWEEPHLINE